MIPEPFSSAVYFHRDLNPKKNTEIRFSEAPQGMPLARYIKMMKVPEIKDINIIGTPRLMQKKDIA
jgi:hypothetical protein